jgi:hypothetical protein
MPDHTLNAFHFRPMKLTRWVISCVILILFSDAFGQGKGIVSGKVTDEKGNPVELVNISVKDTPGGNVTNKDGDFSISIPANREVTLLFSFVGYQTEEVKVMVNPGERKVINRILNITTTVLPDIVIQDKQIRTSNLTRINPRDATLLPSVSGNNIESLIKTLPGVASANELSSQYSVRGGNYDENLVYVNDIEIYRPFLIRASQQEGLSFLNPDMVSSILFSAGGFDAKYGDKMSSVLDIKYKKPTSFAGSVSLSLLEATLHLEGATKNQRFSYLLGVRQKSNQYILKGLDTKGEYKPSFTDVQTLLEYQINKKLHLSFLGYAARNSYKVIPTTRETAFGAINEAYKFTVYFEGQEVDQFINSMGGLTLEYAPRNDLKLKLIASGYKTFETETYDILGQYWIARLETDYTTEGFGQPTETLGVGSFLDHARNDLQATVFNVEHRGQKEKGDHYIQWGLKYQREYIDDKLHEWQLNDSAGFSLPHPPDSIGYTNSELQTQVPFDLMEFVTSSNKIGSNRYTGFVQDSWKVLENDSANVMVTAGVRFNYWDFNRQLVVSPRATVAFKPAWKTDFVFRFSAGYYYQPAFYREMRDLEGNVNPDIRAQKSIQVVLGSDLNFQAWGRPFKFVTEIYYKYLDDLIPYVIDNVRIRYYATNNSHGYATGIDMKVNGEFVPGVESWASLSLMKTMEDIEDDFYYDADSNLVHPGYIRRPTDQRVNFGLFFQDYLPMNPTYKMNMTFLYGTNLPFGPPDFPKYKQQFKSSPYLRVDVGFSKQLIGRGSFFAPKNPLRHIEAMWISLEIFNLLQHLNTVSYIWIKDIHNLEYPVPNRLTPRQLNVRLVVQF